VNPFLVVAARVLGTGCVVAVFAAVVWLVMGAIDERRLARERAQCLDLDYWRRVRADPRRSVRRRPRDIA